ASSKPAALNRCCTASSRTARATYTGRTRFVKRKSGRQKEIAMSAASVPMGIGGKLLWAGVAGLGAVSFGIVALTRGEPVNAAWLVVAAVCIYFIAYRFYALFIVNRALGADPTRQTPAWRRNDGLDYVPTNRYVLYGHHSAA